MENNIKVQNGGDEPKSSPLWNPYLAGVALGLVLLASFLILGAGLGASGGLTRISAFVEGTVAPEHVKSSEYFGQYYGEDKTENPLRYYLVYMLLGIIVGGFASALLAGRLTCKIERGASCSPWLRLVLALVGGVLVGFAARLASGCTSGQALTGGALLLNGSIVFMICVFAGGYATAILVRRQWHD